MWGHLKSESESQSLGIQQVHGVIFATTLVHLATPLGSNMGLSIAMVARTNHPIIAIINGETTNKPICNFTPKELHKNETPCRARGAGTFSCFSGVTDFLSVNRGVAVIQLSKESLGSKQWASPTQCEASTWLSDNASTSR